jgi:hypothetical protein
MATSFPSPPAKADSCWGRRTDDVTLEVARMLVDNARQLYGLVE